MHVLIKYAASVVALLATLSLAQAQSEHQGGGEKGGAKERAPAAQQPSKGETRASPAKEKQPAEQRENERKAEDKKENQQQSNAAGTVTRRPNIHISGVQKTKLHDVMGDSRAFRHYHHSEIHFAVEVGTRVPDDVMFYDAPVEFIYIDPEFSGYKIVVLDDEILVIDPETREIVEVIPI
ncbi:MAG: DUF1236 domain-containing protein [Rhodomicrobium sp.]